MGQFLVIFCQFAFVVCLAKHFLPNHVSKFLVFGDTLVNNFFFQFIIDFLTNLTNYQGCVFGNYQTLATQKLSNYSSHGFLVTMRRWSFEMAMVEKLARGQYNTFFSCIEYFVSLQMCIKENVRWERKKKMFSVPFLVSYGPISPD